MLTDRSIAMKTLLGGYTHEELIAAFDRVKPVTHWKDPIDVGIVEPDPDERTKIAFAVEFFTATKATFEPLGKARFWVTADGYRVGPAGDH